MKLPETSRQDRSRDPDGSDEITIVIPGQSRAAEIRSLTSLRGVAAMLVAIFHFVPQLQAYFPLSEYTHLFSRGYIWVDFFFILSGYIMCYVYGDMFSENVTAKGMKRFLILRFVRLYPLHFATLMVFVLIEFAQLVMSWHLDLTMLAIFSAQTSPFSLLTNVLLLHGFGVNDLPGWNEPSWSISVEMGLYLIFPFLAAWPALRSRWGRAGAVAIALAMLSVIEWRFGALIATIDYGFFRGLGGFLLGIAVYHSPAMKALSRSRYLAAVQVVLVAAVIALLHFRISDVLVIPFFALLVAAVQADAGWLSRVLQLRPLYVLGVLSYSIYMTHNIVGLAFSKRWTVVFPSLEPYLDSPWMVAVFFTEIVLVLVVSWFTYRYVERPARYYLRKRLLSD